MPSGNGCEDRERNEGVDGIMKISQEGLIHQLSVLFRVDLETRIDPLKSSLIEQLNAQRRVITL